MRFRSVKDGCDNADGRASPNDGDELYCDEATLDGLKRTSLVCHDHGVTHLSLDPPTLGEAQLGQWRRHRPGRLSSSWGYQRCQCDTALTKFSANLQHMLPTKPDL